MRRVYLAAIATFLTLLSLPAVANAQSATLAWDPNPATNIAGYRIYYGTQSGVYPNSVDARNVTTYTVQNLDVTRDYFFVVTAYDTSGLSSDFSNEVQLPAAYPAGTTTISSFTASSAYPLLAGTSVTWTAAATSQKGAVEYRFVLYNASTNSWVIAQDYSQANTFTWVPGWADVGSHMVQVWARTIGSPAPYEAYVSTPSFSVNASAMQITASVDFPTPPGNTVTWTASAAGAPAGSTLEYRFYVQGTNGAWTLLRDYATSNTATWTPSATGTYALQVWVRRVGQTVSYEQYGSVSNIVVSRTTLSVSSLTSSPNLPVNTGTPITWTARVKGGTQGPIQYQFWRYSPSGTWTLVQPYSSSPTFTWTPGWNDAGAYQLQVWVKNSGSTATYDAYGATAFTINPAPIQFSMSDTFPVPPGTVVGLNAKVSDPSATFEYQYWLYTQATGTWSLLRPYSTNGNATWTPAVTGTYMLQVWARKVGSVAAYDAYYTTDNLRVSVGPATAISVTPSVSLPSTVGTPVTWTATASGGTAAPLQYKFYLYKEGTGWSLARDYSPTETFTWTPTAAGTYQVQVWVRSAGSAQAYESYTQSAFFVIKP